MAKPDKLSNETTLLNPDADKQPQHVIEYATPASFNPDEKAAFVLGLVAVSLGIILLIFIIGVVTRYRSFGFAGHLIYLNNLALIAGGVGWGLSRHSRPNRAYRWCTWANVLNWIVFMMIVAVLFI